MRDGELLSDYVQRNHEGSTTGLYHAWSDMDRKVFVNTLCVLCASAVNS